MSKGIIRPGDIWQAKKDGYIARRKVVKGTSTRVHGVTAYEDGAFVTTLINSYLETMPAEKFRSIFTKLM